MNIFQQLIANDLLVCSVIAYFVAQVLKIFTTLWRDGEFRLSTIISSGGMPSSHSSTVVALTISCGRVYGVISVSYTHLNAVGIAALASLAYAKQGGKEWT